MTKYQDEMIGAEGEKCIVRGHKATVIAVHDHGMKATVQFEDLFCAVYFFSEIELLGEELPRPKSA